MINSSLLANRLNAFRKGEPLPKIDLNEYLDEDVDKVETKLSHLGNIIVQLINLSYIFLKSSAYGFAFKTVFSTDWTFMGFLAVGFAFELFTSTIFNLFNK